MQRALLGSIIPSIRAISVGFREQKELTVIFYFDRPPTQEDKEIVSDTTAEVLGDIKFDQVNEFCQYSKEPITELPRLSAWIYMRNEFAD